MGEADKLVIIGIMLLLIATGFVAMFNLGERYHPVLSTAFQGSGINIFWTLLLRIIIAPAMIIIPSYVILNIIKESI